MLRTDYPFAPQPPGRRAYGPLESTQVFVRDGFIDRYSGTRLLYPPVLRLISLALPVEFPYHTNWRTDRTHPAYWELSATIDHLQPVARGGVDEETNWVTTSMARNNAKSNSTLDQLGWSLLPPGDFAMWDGMLGWFLEFAASVPELKLPPGLRPWQRAALRVTR